MVDNNRIVLLVAVNAVAFVDLAVCNNLVEAAATFCNMVTIFIVRRKSPQIQDV